MGNTSLVFGIIIILIGIGLGFYAFIFGPTLVNYDPMILQFLPSAGIASIICIGIGSGLLIKYYRNKKKEKSENS